MKKKKIAFIFALPIRTNPILITMPFGLNIIQLLDQRGYEIDVYLSEYRNDSYDGIFSKNVKVHFIDQNYLWRNNPNLAYSLVTKYFRLRSSSTLRNKYSHIFGTGMAGITLASILKKYNKKSQFIYLNDEFPIIEEESIWVDSEIENALNANFVATPDEARYEPLCKQIPGLDKIEHFPLPNTPLIEDLKSTPTINWHEYFGISKEKKLFLSAGGINETYLLPELLRSIKDWPENSILILKGKNDIAEIREKYKDLDYPNKIIWSSDSFSPDELHSLIRYCTASVCLYRNENENIYYMGKSSGKLMRSIGLGKPVIATNFPSLNFVEEMEIGKLVGVQDEIGEAVNYIIQNEAKLAANCIEKYPAISFEKYWDVLEKKLNLS
jgi:glycosyltransferase involved in cell wall biosynthesis